MAFYCLISYFTQLKKIMFSWEYSDLEHVCKDLIRLLL